MKRNFILFAFLLLAISVHAQTQQVTSTIRTLRVNDVGISYGPPNDALAAEVIVITAHNPNIALGFTLRKDDNEVAHRAMLDLLRDAYQNNWSAKLTYTLTTATKGKIIAAELNR